MPRQPPPPGLNVKLPLSLGADAVKAGETMDLSLGQYVERAVIEQLARDRDAFKLKRFAKLEAEATRTNNPRPDPVRYGLPADHGIPSGPR